MKKQEEDDIFAKRLTAMKQEGEERRKALPAAAGRVGGGGAGSAVFEGVTTPLDYSSPPSLSDTLMSQLNSDVSDPKLKTAQIGPNQLGVAAGALALGIMFVIVSGGDLASTSSKRFKGYQPALQPPDEFETGLIKGRIGQLQNAREADPRDLGALEELAISYARLFDFPKASKLLDQLVAAKPGDAEAWRLLGETTLLSQESGRSAAAYERAAELTGNGDLQVLTGLVDAYIANGQQDKAAKKLMGLLAVPAPSSLIATSSPPSPPSPSSSATEGGGAAAVPEAAAAMPTQAPLSSVDSVALDLLLGKVYNGWRGHDTDALAVYEGLVKGNPEDFRGYLAKGLYLKDHGRRADADRMFLQAKYYAPPSRQGLIQKLAGEGPVLDNLVGGDD